MLGDHNSAKIKVHNATKDTDCTSSLMLRLVFKSLICYWEETNIEPAGQFSLHG